ncbi:PTPRJ isoform 8, partial [Pan troglodytes]
MKPAAREARLPPRSPGLRWALPLLLLLLRLGQILCAGGRPSPVFDIKAVSISPTNVILTWKSNDTAASEYKYVVKNKMENEKTVTVVHQPWCNITGLRPATSYVFSITPGIGNETWGDPR